MPVIFAFRRAYCPSDSENQLNKPKNPWSDRVEGQDGLHSCSKTSLRDSILGNGVTPLFPHRSTVGHSFRTALQGGHLLTGHPPALCRGSHAAPVGQDGRSGFFWRGGGLFFGAFLCEFGGAGSRAASPDGTAFLNMASDW